MKRLSLLLLFALAFTGISFGQLGTASVTYTDGDIETDKNFTWYDGSQSSNCPGQMTVNIPVDAIILQTDVSYDMTSDENSAVYRQRSHFRCVSPGGTSEASLTNGPSIYVPGTASYSRTVDIANDVVGGGDIMFELHAGATYYKNYCSTDSVKVDNNTWTVTVTYIPAGFPAQALNPDPVDGGLYVGLDDDLTWDFGANTETFDVYFGTDNPPTTKLVDNEIAGASGIFDPGTMDETTTYYWQVVSRNANGYTDGPVWSFTTVCGAFVTPFTEDFESVTIPEIPYCWTSIVNSTSSWATVESATYYGVNGSQCLKLYNESDISATLMFVSPQIDLGAGSLADKMVHFSMTGFSYPSIVVGTMSDPNDETTFTAYKSFLVWDYLTEHDVYLNDYTGTDSYVAFKLSTFSSYQEAYLDEITIDELPACIKPTDLFADNLTISSAWLNWTDLNGASAWNIEFGPAGFTPTGTPTVSGVSNPHEITGLTSATEYDFYVQADCGGGDVSAWTGPATFLTPCDYYTTPLVENFDASFDLPLCWTSIVQSGDGWTLNGVQSFNAHSDYNCFHMDNGWDQNSTLILSLPPIETLSDKGLKFYAKNALGEYDLEIGTMSNPNDQNTFIPLTSVTTTTTYQEFEVWFNGYTGTDEYIALKHGNGSAFLGMYLDDVSVDLLPSCLPPTNGFVDNITTTDAQFHWSESGMSADWIVEVGEAGFTPGTGSYLTQYLQNDINGGEQMLTLEGLTAATTYDVYVQADCGDEDLSDWSSRVRFLTQFPNLSIPVYEDFESGMGITGNAPTNNQDWNLTTEFAVSGEHSVHNAYDVSSDNSLYILGNFDFTAKTDIMLSFWQIAKSDGSADHCYVEISTDGGQTFDQLSESTYFGAGSYSEEGLYNNPEGPCFDQLSYPEWGGFEVENSWWKKEYFNLSDYSAFDNVQLRFRLVSDEWGSNSGWFIDDIALEALGTSVFNVDPLSIAEEVPVALPLANVDLNLENSGTFPASYTVQVAYDEMDLLNENFNSGIPADWTVEANGTSVITWDVTSDIYGQNFDGTEFAWIDGDQNFAPVDLTMNDDLISPAVDASAYTDGTLLLEFEQVFDANWSDGDTARVYVFDGADWIMIYESWTDDGNFYGNIAHKSFDVSAYANAGFMVKFNYVEGPMNRGRYYAIDNVRLRASMSALNWLSVDGSVATSGVCMPGNVNVVNVEMNGTGLGYGTYNANLEVTSDSPDKAVTVVPVSMTVLPPAPPTALTAVADLAQIDLTYMLNEAGDDVIIATNSMDMFDQPENGMDYPTGEMIGNNGTVIYQGSMTEFTHADLSPNTTYYYKAWSVANTAMYSLEAASANATTGDYQLICLPAGWSGVSSYKVPESPALEDVLSEISDELVIMVSNTGIYWAPYNINTIGNWDTQKGYKVKMNEQACFPMVGETTGNKTISLNAGTYYIPVLCDQPVDADVIFSQFGNSLIYAFDLNTGNAYWPEGEIYTLDMLEPGVGYVVSLSEPGEATFSCEGSKNMNYVKAQKEQFENAPWNYTQTGNQHLISINKSAFIDLNNGDFVGVFNSYGACTGYTQYNGEDSNLLLVAYSDDMTTDEIDGLQEGESMTFMVFSQSQQFETEVAVKFAASMPNAGSFVDNGRSMILKLGESATTIGENDANIIRIYPNPATTKLIVELEGDHKETMLNLVDMSGRNIMNRVVFDKVELDVSSLKPGVYFLEINNGTNVETQKVIIK